MMKHSRKLWIVVADGEHARIVVPGHAGGSFRTETSWQSETRGARSSNLGSDRPGRSFESADPSRHAIAPKHDLHELEKTKFLHGVADRANAAAGEHVFDRLVLVAPAHAKQDLLKHLAHAALAKLDGYLEKDLTKVPDQELGERLARWAQPVEP